MTVDHSAEIRRLRATVGDLLALSTIPEMWLGREPSAIVAELADVLIESLQLDFAFARLSDPNGLQNVEATRGDSWKTFPEWLQQRLAASGGRISEKEIVTKVSGVEGSGSGLVIPIGVNGERGLVAAASDRPGFPDQIDEQLLSVSANNAATAFQNAFLINELRGAQQALRANEQELRNARDELEIKVAERTSELQRSAQELQRSEFYLAEGQRLALMGSWGFSSAGFDYWSPELFRIHGLDAGGETPTVEEYLALVHPEDREFVLQRIQEMLASRRGFDFTKRIVRPDGQIRSVRCVGVLANQEENFLRFAGTGMDVTEQAQLMEEMRKSEEELRQMLDFAPQLIAVYGPNRERLYANSVALDYAGLSIDQWRRTEALGAFIHPDDREQELAYFARAQSNGSAGQLELRLRGGDGSYRWFLARYNSVRDDKGQIRRWYVTCTDIEDRKRAEEKLQQENVALREEIDRASMFEEIVGTSPALQTVLTSISKVAPTDSTVLITGETGTGKELVARAIHRRSNRASRAFVSVNCAAIPHDLIASELFGHEKGAFTGAMQRRPGRFELADGGTIFLDEVGELLPDTQVALLRVLQEREFERVGGTQSISVDVRIVAATNRDLKAAVANGTFREDLYYRLNVFPLEMPPLRARRADIPLLVEYFIDRYARKAGKNIRSVDKKTLDLLQSYDWPGNIRELQNIIERSVILSSGGVFSADESWLSKETLPPAFVETSAQSRGAVEPHGEREIIEAMLAETRGRVWGSSGAAAKLGIPPSTLDHRIKALRIDKKQFKYQLKADQNHQNH
jgi:formate hydrogenlyase transcriptional activator